MDCMSNARDRTNSRDEGKIGTRRHALPKAVGRAGEATGAECPLVQLVYDAAVFRPLGGEVYGNLRHGTDPAS